MDLYELSTKLNKKIEKIEKVLSDGMALTPAQRQAKQAEVQSLHAQIQSLQSQLKPTGVTKVIHKQ